MKILVTWRLGEASILYNPADSMRVRGGVAQLGERIVRNDEVAGSIPVTSTNFLLKVP